MTPSRAGLVIVLLCFCAPLFVSLGRADLRGDEAGHSFAVARMIEAGDWLVPKSSPHEDAEFLEKPPLKFWIVALPIRLGLLPHDEFGLRFWDALFGGLAFVYVYLIGRRLAGAVCGVAAVAILFAFYPLVFDHGLRTNNMEAALLVCYCGGVYHFMAAADGNRARRHAVSVALCFTLGFMTKFVAALFLPLILAFASRLIVPYRESVRREWRSWLLAAAVAAALIVPWFLYATLRFGQEVWAVMLGQHVVERMTTALDVAHIRPWSYYWVTIYKTLSYAGALALVALGLVALAVQTFRRQWADAGLVLIWAFVPLAIISVGTSKLIHYMYPYLPPFALAGGYLAALIVMLAPAPLERLGLPRLAMATAALALAILAVATAALGELHLTVAGHVLFRSSAVFRPIVAALGAAGLALGTRPSVRLAAVALALVLVPLPAYAQNLMRLDEGGAPLRELRDCLTGVEANQDASARGLYVDLPDAEMQHHVYYYMRVLQPWLRADSSKAVDVAAVRESVLAGRPLLFSDTRFRALVEAWYAGEGRLDLKMPQVASIETARVLLPGAYAACRPASAPR